MNTEFFKGPTNDWSTSITDKDLDKIIAFSGIVLEDDIRLIAASIVVNLINLSLRENGFIDIKSPVLIQSIQFGCQLRKVQIKKILTILANAVKYYDNRYRLASRINFFAGGYFILIDNQVNYIKSHEDNNILQDF